MSAYGYRILGLTSFSFAKSILRLGFIRFSGLLLYLFVQYLLFESLVSQGLFLFCGF